MPRPKCPRFRNGFTTMELVVSLSSATVLALGLASAVFVAGSSLGIASRDPAYAPKVGDPAAALRRDLLEATAIEFSDEKLQITVPDRSGDDVEEQLVYSKSGDDLVLAENGSDPYTFIEDISSLSLESFRVSKDAGVNDAVASGTEVTVEASRHFRADAANSINIGIPAGTQRGDLLLNVDCAGRSRSSTVRNQRMVMAGNPRRKRTAIDRAVSPVC